MSNYTVETIEVTDTARIRVEYDQDVTKPRKDWDMLTGFVKIEGEGDRGLIDVEPVHNDPTSGITSAHARFDEASYQWRPAEDEYPGRYVTLFDAEVAIVRWARIFYGLLIEWDSEHGGYWFVDPSGLQQNFPAVPNSTLVARFRQVEGAPINTYEDYQQESLDAQREIIRSEQETYRQWAAGEVYGVIFEREESFIRAKVTRTEHGFEMGTDTPDIFDEWEELASLWGCFLDDDYTAEMVAIDLDVEFTEEEEAALKAAVADQYARSARRRGVAA